MSDQKIDSYFAGRCDNTAVGIDVDFAVAVTVDVDVDVDLYVAVYLLIFLLHFMLQFICLLLIFFVVEVALLCCSVPRERGVSQPPRSCCPGK